MLHQVRRAVDPRLPLRQVLDAWPQLCRRLAEAPRKRRPRSFTGVTQTS